MGHVEGALAQRVRERRHSIVGMIAHLEASIGFPEEDIEEVTAQQVKSEVEEALAEIDRLLATKETGRILRDGLETVIIGKPNVGKSSLLNALLREKRAIVTDIPGTTRDVIEEYVNIRGIPLKIIDTAGIRETTDIVEQIGVVKHHTRCQAQNNGKHRYHIGVQVEAVKEKRPHIPHRTVEMYVEPFLRIFRLESRLQTILCCCVHLY